MTDISAEVFIPDADLQKEPLIQSGYVLSGGPVRWLRYKPQGAKQMKRKGRWQAMNEYAGWGNCETPAEIWTDPIDYRAQSARIAELEAALQNVMGHINTPISRRRLGISNNWPEWFSSGCDALIPSNPTPEHFHLPNCIHLTAEMAKNCPTCNPNPDITAAMFGLGADNDDFDT